MLSIVLSPAFARLPDFARRLDDGEGENGLVPDAIASAIGIEIRVSIEFRSELIPIMGSDRPVAWTVVGRLPAFDWSDLVLLPMESIGYVSILPYGGGAISGTRPIWMIGLIIGLIGCLPAAGFGSGTGFAASPRTGVVEVLLS